jgi:hypothetical protein
VAYEDRSGKPTLLEGHGPRMFLLRRGVLFVGIPFREQKTLMVVKPKDVEVATSVLKLAEKRFHGMDEMKKLKAF